MSMDFDLVLGLDPSIAAFGISDGVESIAIKTTNDFTLRERCGQLFAGICEFHRAALDRAGISHKMDAKIAWFVEGPMLGMNANTLYEVGWIMAHVYDAADSCEDVTILEVHNSHPKKFVAGAGNADKVRMALAVSRKWGVEFEDDRGCNKLDAFAIQKYGMAIVAGIEPYKPVEKRGSGRDAAAVHKRR